MNVRWIAFLQSLFVAAMFAAAAWAWPRAPESVPVHFGLNGQANRYGDMVEGLLIFPIVALGVFALLKLAPRIDPLRTRYQEFSTAYELIILTVEVFMALAYAIMLAVILGAQINVSMLILALVGLLLAAIGGILDHLRPNWFLGIRTPWTLSSERAWTATHRAGRWVFVVMGALLILAGLLQSAWMLYVAMSACAIGTLGLVAYSFFVWREDPNRHSLT